MAAEARLASSFFFRYARHTTAAVGPLHLLRKCFPTDTGMTHSLTSRRSTARCLQFTADFPMSLGSHPLHCQPLLALFITDWFTGWCPTQVTFTFPWVAGAVAAASRGWGLWRRVQGCVSRPRWLLAMAPGSSQALTAQLGDKF